MKMVAELLHKEIILETTTKVRLGLGLGASGDAETALASWAGMGRLVSPLPQLLQLLHPHPMHSMSTALSPALELEAAPRALRQSLTVRGRRTVPRRALAPSLINHHRASPPGAPAEGAALARSVTGGTMR